MSLKDCKCPLETDGIGFYIIHKSDCKYVLDRKKEEDLK